MEKNEYQSKFFLTGFLLASGVILYLTMTFVAFFLVQVISSLSGSVAIGIVSFILTGIGYFYCLHRFEQKQTYSKMAIWYVLTICLLGLIISTLCFMSVYSIFLVSIYRLNYLIPFVYLGAGYFVVTEVFSIGCLLAASLELREIKYRRFIVVYIISVITMLLVGFIFKTTVYSSIGASIITVISSFVCAYYILNRQKQNIEKFELDSIESRYRFVIQGIVDCALAPIQIPIDLKNKLTKK